MAVIEKHARVCDWCHLCGNRSDQTADVWHPVQPNAEHASAADHRARLLTVDQAMRSLPTEWRPALLAEFFPPGEGEPRRPEALYVHRTGRPSGRFRRERDLGLSWIASRLAGDVG